MGDRMHGLQPGDEVYSGSHGGRHDAIHSAVLAFHARCCAIRAPAGRRVADPPNQLGVNVEALLGSAATSRRSAGKRGPQPKIAQQLERIRTLPAAEQRAISKVIDAVLAAHR